MEIPAVVIIIKLIFFLTVKRSQLILRRRFTRTRGAEYGKKKFNI